MGIRLSMAALVVLGLFSEPASASWNGIYSGDLHPVTLSDSLQSVAPGSVVIIGENHGFWEHQQQQIAVMTQLRSQGLKVSVGMEFFTYTDQPWVDQYRAGRLSEADFLAQIAWGSPSFDFYRDQALFPDLSQGGQTWALNAPRSLTSHVARRGLASLTEEQRALLPPQFELGRATYKERFMKLMPHLPNPEAGERYFAAQSIWDDTMAWRATEFIRQYPDQVLIIVVGDFHVQFGGGLPDRIRLRSAGAIPVLTFSQVNTEGLSNEEIEAEISVSPTYGVRADYLWLAPAKGPAN